MEFGTKTSSLEMSEGFTVKESGIGDMGIIFQILSGLYNDPQRIIVQEYIANARDAHREINKGDVAVDVTLPTYLESELKIRDYGPGISPDRMSNVFINYGASTKRGDNLQTGGFGIGAKSVFCYTDSCTVETWADGIYYNYSYMVDDDKKPKCILIDSFESSEPTGTRISINIASSDLNTVCANVYFVTQYWSVRPNILNGDVFDGKKYSDYRIIANGDRWQFLDGRGTKCHVIIDEIPYKFEFDNVFKEYGDRQKFDAIFRSGNFDFMVKTGEVTMSPNREGPIYDVMSRKCLKEIAENAYDTIKQNIIDDFARVDNIFDAFELYQKYGVFKALIGDISWKKFNLRNDRIKLDSRFYKTSLGHRGGRRSTKPQCNYCHDISVDRTMLYIINDDYDQDGKAMISTARLKTILQTNNNFYVIEIVPYDPKYHNELLTEEDYDAAFDAYNLEINMDSFKLVKMTSFEKYKAPRRVRSEKTNIYSFNRSGNVNRPTSNWIGVNADFEELEGYFVEYEKGTPVGFTINNLKEICNMFNIEIHGVPSRYMKIADKVDTLMNLKEYLMGELENLQKYIEDNNDIIYSKLNLEYVASKQYTFRRLQDSTKNIMINCPDTLAYFSASEYMEKLASIPCDTKVMEKFNLLKEMLRLSVDAIVTPNHNIKGMVSDLFDKYPLLTVFNNYDTNDKVVTHLNHYLEYMILHKENIQQNLGTTATVVP